MSHHIIEFKNISFCYSASTHVLNDLSFKIEHGESIAILGANGAGKSTLLNLIIGNILPTQGDIIVGDHEVKKENLKEIRRSVGMIFQNPDDQLFMPTVYEDVSFGPYNLGFSQNKIAESVKKSLNSVNAWHLKDRPPFKLSGGEKRRVAIATVMAMNPNILLLDEPSTNLDWRSKEDLISILKNFTHTKIIATHDLNLVARVCTRSIILDDNKIVADGHVDEIFKDSQMLIKCGVGPFHQ